MGQPYCVVSLNGDFRSLYVTMSSTYTFVVSLSFFALLVTKVLEHIFLHSLQRYSRGVCLVTIKVNADDWARISADTTKWQKGNRAFDLEAKKKTIYICGRTDNGRGKRCFHFHKDRSAACWWFYSSFGFCLAKWGSQSVKMTQYVG